MTELPFDAAAGHADGSHVYGIRVPEAFRQGGRLGTSEPVRNRPVEINLGEESLEQSHLRRASLYLPATTSELLERHEVVLDLHRTGGLSEEMVTFGVKPTWLRQYHDQDPFVALAEQHMPMPSIFHNLGNFGSPAALCRAANLLNFLRGKMTAIHGRDVSAGIMSSPYDQITFSGVTNGFFFSMPSLGALVDSAVGRKGPSELVENLHLFSKKSREKLGPNNVGGVGYSSVTIDIDKIEAVISWLENALEKLNPSFRKHVNSLKNLNELLQKNGATLGESEVRRLSDQRAEKVGRIRNCHEIIRCLEYIRDDIAYALGECRVETGQSSVPFWNFIEHYNSAFTKRLGFNFPVSTISNGALLAFPSLGVDNWGRLLKKFVDNGVILPNDSVVRWRVDMDSQLSRYVSLTIDQIHDGDVILKDRQGQTYSAQSLQERSAQSLDDGRGPRLIPGASLRYWINYAIGNLIALDDGIPYPKIARLAAAVDSPSFSLHPRKIVLFPYTKLWSYTPPNSDDPYQELTPTSSTFDYYRFLLRKGSCQSAD